MVEEPKNETLTVCGLGLLVQDFTVLGLWFLGLRALSPTLEDELHMVEALYKYTASHGLGLALS